MMRRAGAVLLIVAGVVLLVVQNVHASETDGFDALTRALGVRYQIQPKSIPMMWLVNLGARGFTHGGVKGMKVVQFSDIRDIEDRKAFDELVDSKLGENWSRAVREREENGEESMVYMHADDGRMEMILVNLEHGELNLVRMSMNPDQIAQWMKEKEKRAIPQ
jgi:hypothetical protein